jgi:hypothetical protein
MRATALFPASSAEQAPAPIVRDNLLGNYT